MDIEQDWVGDINSLLMFNASFAGKRLVPRVAMLQMYNSELDRRRPGDTFGWADGLHQSSSTDRERTDVLIRYNAVAPRTPPLFYVR